MVQRGGWSFVSSHGKDGGWVGSRTPAFVKMGQSRRKADGWMRCCSPCETRSTGSLWVELPGHRWRSHALGDLKHTASWETEHRTEITANNESMSV